MEANVRFDFIDLIRRFLLKWRMILIFVLIGALLFNTYSFVRQKQKANAAEKARAEVIKNMDNQTEAETQSSEIAEPGEQIIVYTPEEYAQEYLNENLYEEVVNTAAVYSLYQRQYQDIMEYVSHSVWLSLDAARVPTVTTQYHIDTHYEAVYPVTEYKDETDNIGRALINILKTEQVMKSMAEAAGLDAAPAYLMELVDVSLSGDNLLITVRGKDEASCNQMMSVLKQAVSVQFLSLRTKYGQFDISEISTNYSERVETSILSTRQTQNSNMNTIRSQMNALTSGLSKRQLKVLNAIVDNTNVEVVISGANTDKTEDEPEVIAELPKVPAVHLISKKYLLLGAVIGLFLVAVWTVIEVLAKGRLRMAKDLEEGFGVHEIGTLPVQKKKKPLDAVDRTINRWFAGGVARYSEEERLDMICAGIRLYAEKNGIGKMYLTGTSKEIPSVFEKMKNRLDTLEVNSGRSVVYDPESLARMAESEAVILLEQVDETRYSELDRELKLCKEYRIPVIGSIVLTD